MCDQIIITVYLYESIRYIEWFFVFVPAACTGQNNCTYFMYVPAGLLANQSVYEHNIQSISLKITVFTFFYYYYSQREKLNSFKKYIFSCFYFFMDGCVKNLWRSVLFSQTTYILKCNSYFRPKMNCMSSI